MPRAVPDALRQPPADGGQIVPEQGVGPERLHDRALVVQRPGSYSLRKVGTVLGNTASLSRIFPAELAARRLTDKSILQFLTSSGNRNSGQGILKNPLSAMYAGSVMAYIKIYFSLFHKLKVIFPKW